MRLKTSESNLIWLIIVEHKLSVQRRFSTSSRLRVFGATIAVLAVIGLLVGCSTDENGREITGDNVTSETAVLVDSADLYEYSYGMFDDD